MIQMAMEMVEKNKKYLKKRINEIIDDYLFDKGESYCRVQLWFEKSNGEHQEKVLAIGKPSNKVHYCPHCGRKIEVGE